MEGVLVEPSEFVSLPASGLYEYLLVVYPDKPVYDKLIDEKQEFYQQYGEPVTGKTKPHIVIADFLAWEPMEEILGRWIQRICCRHQSFPVTLNNYSGFPLHTIYIRIEDPRPFRQLAKELKSIDEFIRSSACPPVKLVDRPWLSVAGRLAEQVYSRAMADYSQKIFHESFLASELVLLKRKHPLDTCKVVNIFRFLPAGPDCREAA